MLRLVVAVILVVVLMSMSSCTNNLLGVNDTSVQAGDGAGSGTNVVSETVIVTEVYYNDCNVDTTTGTITIYLDPTCNYAQMQLHNHPCMPYFNDWELDVGMVVWYDYRLHHIRIDDPRKYFGSSYQFKVIQFCGK
jgi:protein involved in sex pheromone biosynthesis